MSSDEYLGLIQPGVTYPHIAHALRGNSILHKDLATWLVSPVDFAGQALEKGAGQFRAIGKALGLHGLQKIHERIQKIHTKLTDIEATTELTSLYNKMADGNETSDGETSLQIVIVSSLAGGTGAGILLTVSDLIRSMDFDGESIAILYTPDVFTEHGNTDGTAPNSLAAISELLNGRWWKGEGEGQSASFLSPDMKSPGSLETLGLGEGLPSTGPTYPFLVGMTNSQQVNHGDKKSLFEIVGRAMMTWATNKKFQEDFFVRVQGNWQASQEGKPQKSQSYWNAGKRSEKLFPTVSSLGFSRISMGTQYFEEYAARRLARDSLYRTVHEHTQSSESQAIQKESGNIDSDELAAKVAELHLKTMLISTGLDEEGPDANQIQDALTPDNAEELKRELRQQIMHLAEIGGTGKRSPKEWGQAIEQAVSQSWSNYAENYSRSVDQKTEEWAENVQEKLFKEINRCISDRGLKITEALITQMAEKLEHIATELRSDDVPRFEGWAALWQEYLREKIDGLGKGDIPASSDVLSEAVDIVVHYLEFLGNEICAERAGELASDMVMNVFTPLTFALSDAFGKASDSWEEIARSWPTWEEVEPQKELSPLESEFVMIKQEKWHNLFEELLEGSMPEPEDGQDNTAKWRRQEVRRIISMGDFSPSPEGEDQTIQADVKWVPNLPHFIQLERRPQRLEISVNTDAEALKSRALKWMNRPATKFGTLLKQALRSYLEPEGEQISSQELKNRRSDFIANLQSALKASDPLVNLHKPTYDQVYEPSSMYDPPEKNINGIPLEATKLQADVERALTSEGVDQYVMNSDATAKSIDITTTLMNPLNILTLKSLLSPILESWTRAVAANDATGFWARRRSTPLTEFVPTSQAALHCMVRGWFTGILLGKIDTKSIPRRIANPTNSNRPATFPEIHLDGSNRASAPSDMGLAQTLEDLAIAIIESTSSNQLQPLNAYRLLRDLGRDEGALDGSIFVYESPNKDLIELIMTGDVKGSIKDHPVPILSNKAYTAQDITTPEGRRAGLADAIGNVEQKFIKDFEEWQEELKENVDYLHHCENWIGMAQVVIQELEKLQYAVRAYSWEESEDLF